MASLIFNSALYDGLTGAVDFDGDTFKVMLVTSAYSPNKTTHTKRSNVTNEVANGGGYTTGGAAATVTVTNDTANTRVDVSLGAASWANATITARGAVYYKSRGGAASADELVAYVDFGSDIVSTNGAFSLSASTLRIAN
jgi:preprotein translocase subunit YajC